MSVTDPIADMLSALRNASQAGRKEVVVPFSGLKERLASLLKREGFVAGARKFKEKGGSCFFLSIELRYGEDGLPKLHCVKRVSKPSRRTYTDVKRLKSPPTGIRIISTSHGLMTSVEARKRRLGGEVIADVW